MAPPVLCFSMLLSMLPTMVCMLTPTLRTSTAAFKRVPTLVCDASVVDAADADAALDADAAGVVSLAADAAGVVAPLPPAGFEWAEDVIGADPIQPELELEQRPMLQPPPRSATTPGYVTDPALVTWVPFQYAQPSVRRQAARDFVRNNLLQKPPLPPLRVVLLGGVATGKGTIAPMLSQAFRVRCLGVGALLRGESRAGRPRGLEASRTMADGELLPDELVLEMLQERLGGGTDASRNGWLLDGFPRTESQARAVVDGDEWADLRPDAVILVERPDELAREFSLGRCCDSATGQTYHPVYAPPPVEVQERLVWRVDDTPDALNRRIAEHQSSIEAIVTAFEGAGVPLRRVDNARSELETFDEVAIFLEGVAMEKLVKTREQLELDVPLSEVADAMQPSPADPTDVTAYCKVDESEEECLERFAEEQRVSLSPDDVDVYCDPDEPEGECVVRYQEEQQAGALLAAVQRCNAYELTDFTPLLCASDVEKEEGDEEQIGWVNTNVLEALTTQLAVGRACELVEASQLAPGTAAAAAAFRAKGGLAVRVAPGATGMEERSELVAALVSELVADGIIPRSKLRHELMDVQPFSAGFIVASSSSSSSTSSASSTSSSSSSHKPALRMERAAMIYFGVPSYGVHVNGWVRDPQDGSSSVPWGIWVATRSMSKATYPGLLDQVVAGGQPAGLSFEDNVRKECEEEASFPPEVISTIVPSGSVSYRYATPKGLSTKVLMAYDLEMPNGLQPLCSDGEVEEFRLLQVGEVLRSLREDLPLWKPNSALVAIDFCVRHGLVGEEEPGYEEIVLLLRQSVL